MSESLAFTYINKTQNETKQSTETSVYKKDYIITGFHIKVNTWVKMRSQKYQN